MKTYPSLNLIAVLGAAAGLAVAMPRAAAQQAPAATPAPAGDHIVIPLSHPTQPATLKVSSLSGTITVRAYNGQDVVVDGAADSGDASRRERRERTPPPEAQGMHRLNVSPGMTAEEDNNVVTVHTSVFGGGEGLVIQVPARTSLTLRTVNGGLIEVDGVTGDINAEATNGRIVLHEVSGSVVANALNGRIEATVAHLDAAKPSSFSSLNGNIDVTLPADVHCNLRLKTDHGDIYLDDGFNFQATRGPGSTNAGTRDAEGMYKVQLDRTTYGTLNGGGPEIRISNFNGNIYLRKGK